MTDKQKPEELNQAELDQVVGGYANQEISSASQKSGEPRSSATKEPDACKSGKGSIVAQGDTGSI